MSFIRSRMGEHVYYNQWTYTMAFYDNGFEEKRSETNYSKSIYSIWINFLSDRRPAFDFKHHLRNKTKNTFCDSCSVKTSLYKECFLNSWFIFRVIISALCLHLFFLTNLFFLMIYIAYDLHCCVICFFFCRKVYASHIFNLGL